MKHLPNFVCKTVPPKKMRYKDLGDWWDDKNGWQLRTPEDVDMDYEFGRMLHEIIERYECFRAGITDEMVNGWIHRNPGKLGGNIKAPHRKQHLFALRVEKLFCDYHKINWNKYGKDSDLYMKNMKVGYL